MSLLLVLKIQDALNHTGCTLPTFSLAPQLLLSGLRYRVELRLAVIFRSPPFGSNPTLLLETNQRRVNSTFIKLEQVLADLFEAARNTVPVQRPKHFKRPQNHHIER